MKNLLKQKQDFKLIDNQVKIKFPKPEFMFAYSYDTDDIDKEDKVFQKEYKKLKAPINVIKLKKGSKKLLN